MERWVPVRGYEDTYEVSDLGRVRRKAGSERCIKARILRAITLKQRGGYLMVSLWKDNRGLSQRVHRIVYESFNRVSLPPDVDVHHKNLDRVDNRLENLEALPESEHHRKEEHRHVSGVRHRSAKLNPDLVRQIRDEYARGEAGYRVISQRFGITPENVRDVVLRRTWRQVA